MSDCKCFTSRFKIVLAALLGLMLCSGALLAQGVTTASMSGIVTDNSDNQGLIGANVVAVHEPSGTRYGTATRDGGYYNIPNMRIGGPYAVTVTYVGYREQSRTEIFLRLGQDTDVDFRLVAEAVTGQAVTVIGEVDEVLNSDRTGAATYINENQVTQLPSIRRSTRDLTRLDPRSDGNFSFGGKNWLYNNISLDGSYFNNSFGLDDPAPGGQSLAEPVPFDAIEQVQVSIAPFDVRQGGFTGAGINSVTKSGSNNFEGSVYSFLRNESLLGNSVRGEDVIADPDLTFNQSGFTFGGALIPNKLFFFVNGERIRRDDPGTDFAADEDGNVVFGESRVDAATMQRISDRMMDVYNYDTGPFQGFIHESNSDKLLAKLDWNINNNNNLTLRYNFLDASREQGPHPFVLSLANTGRGPNASSLPFRNSGYQINNELHSFALELNSRSNTFANRFFASYNRFRDFRLPFSEDFPTIEIGEAGVTYTTLGHEPFSIHNILDQDVFQLVNNLSLYSGKHVFTIGASFDYWSFFNSFNIFRHGVFFLPDALDFLGGATFSSLDDFFLRTDPAGGNFYDFRSVVGSGPFKGEQIDVGQLAFYAQDEYQLSPNFNLTYGLRVDFPLYITDPVENPFSTGLTALDENDNSITVDQAEFPGATPHFSPRLGFNWDVSGDRSTQVRGGTGIFTGRVPFVWIGNVVSNPGANPNLFPGIAEADIPQDHVTDERVFQGNPERSVLQQSFDLNAIDPDFKLPQVWTTNIAVDKQLGGGWLGTLEFLYGKDLNAVVMRNADLPAPVRFLNDGRPYFTNANGEFELNPDGGAGIYVLDNTSEGYHYNLSAQLRKQFNSGLNTSLSYTFQQARNQFRSTEIASVLWQSSPVQGDPNDPNLGFSEFGNRHRIVGGATYRKEWSPNLATHFGLFIEAAEGGRHTAAGGNRFSFIYSGDVNGDGQGGNDLIYIPANQGEINLETFTDAGGNVVSAQEQWNRLDAFIEQDKYLSNHRGEIAERFGLINEWFSTIDLRVLQDFSFDVGAKKHTFQVNLDILNLASLLGTDLGVRKIPSASALAPLRLVGFDGSGEPVFNFTGPDETFIDDPREFSRWRIQLGLRYFFN